VATTKKNANPAEPEASEPTDPPAPAQDTEDPTSFILSRARSEVHLLLDNISANPDVTIATLSARTKPKGLPKDWIEQVCEITWPPQDAVPDPDELAKQAALLIKTRDYLNGLARPASGSTIAFTLMVTEETDAKQRRRRRRAEPGLPPPPSRTSLAEVAYPDLVERARSFRRLLSWTLIFSVGVLCVTLLISWYLAVGNAALADYAAAQTALVEADARVGAAQSALRGAAGAEAGAAAQPVAQPAPQPAAPPAAQPAPAAVQSAAGAPPQGETPSPNPLVATLPASATPPAPANNYLLYPCRTRTGADPSAELRDACLARKVLADRFVPVRRGLDAWAIGAGPETASWEANLLGTGVLPVLYGLLGAIAAVVRALSRKIKASLLSPRDVQLTFLQLALGAVVGACISLFIAAPAAGASDTALLGPVALSSSAISFVAGFGVESVFQALEALISRIFNIAPAGMTGRQETGPPA
jgi:hypothetical protein